MRLFGSETLESEVYKSILKGELNPRIFLVSFPLYFNRAKNKGNLPALMSSGSPVVPGEREEKKEQT